MRLAPALSVLALASTLAVAGCAPSTPDDGKTQVLAAAYPLQFIAERVGGDAVTVTSLAPAGTEPHDLELSPAQVSSMSKADLVVYLSGFQAAVDTAVAEVDPVAIDVAASAHLRESEHENETEDEHAEHDHGDFDPHFWLDPLRMADAADAVAASLAKADPDNAETFTANAAELRTELEALDSSYREGLATCEITTIVVSHEAYGYLADSYGLTQVGIAGIDPEGEPSPARLREIEAVITETGVTTIFTESLINPRVAEVLAADLGITTAVLNPVESVGEGQDYLGEMESNLTALRTALRCS